MTSINQRAAKTSSLLAFITAGIALISIGNPFGTAIGTLGIIVFTIGLISSSRQILSLGTVFLFIGMIAAGIFQTSTEQLLVGMTAVVLSWDTGEHVINIGEQLGRAAKTQRAELAHFANSTLVGIIAVLTGYVIFILASGGQPVAALILLLLAAVILLSVLKE